MMEKRSILDVAAVLDGLQKQSKPDETKIFAQSCQGRWFSSSIKRWSRLF